MPDVTSVPLKAIPTGPLYQPFTSAARAGVPAVASGGVSSTFILSCTVTDAVPSSALQSSFVPVVSAVYVLSWQPITVASDGSTVQSIDTSVRCPPRAVLRRGGALVRDNRDGAGPWRCRERYQERRRDRRREQSISVRRPTGTTSARNGFGGSLRR